MWGRPSLYSLDENASYVRYQRVDFKRKIEKGKERKVKGDAKEEESFSEDLLLDSEST